jgi:uncharacterized membrane protein YbhN (UPF0104 family)
MFAENWVVAFSLIGGFFILAVFWVGIQYISDKRWYARRKEKTRWDWNKVRIVRADSATFENKEDSNWFPSIKLPKIKFPKIEFKDSGWVLLYQVCGWICIVCGIVILLVALGADDKSSEPFIFFASSILSGLACFFGAHVLRLLEKNAHHAERSSELMEKNLELLGAIAQSMSDKDK